MRRSMILSPARLLGTGLLCTGALAQTADFDLQSEGALGTSYTENGILFSDLDRYLGSSNEVFTIEDASTGLAGLPGFTSPNTLGFGGYSAGGAVGFSRVGSMNITPPATASQAELTLFVAGGTTSGNVITLEALAGGGIVAGDDVVVPASFGPHAFTMTVAGGSFDQLRIVGTGASQSGAFFAVMDTLSIGGSFGTNYCTSTSNSTGQPASISATGSNSLAANDLVLHAEPVPDQPGLFYYGPNQVLTPFGNGFRCVGGTVGRLDITNGMGNALTHPLDNTQPPSAAVVITAGSTWNFQAWYRDPAAGGAAFNLSDGLEVTFQP